jgi:Lipocalin-like domain
MMLKRIVIAVVLCLFVAVPVFAQQKVASSAEQLIGYWTLVSVTNEKDGKITETFGPNPKGLFIFDRSGRYVVLQFKADIPKFASNSRDKGTPEENRAVVQGSSVHYGTYTVNEKEGSFTLRPEAATFPNWVGIDQKRSFSISDDVLMITNPSGSTGGTSKLVLKRAK